MQYNIVVFTILILYSVIFNCDCEDLPKKGHIEKSSNKQVKSSELKPEGSHLNINKTQNIAASTPKDVKNVSTISNNSEVVHLHENRPQINTPRINTPTNGSLLKNKTALEVGEGLNLSHPKQDNKTDNGNIKHSSNVKNILVDTKPVILAEGGERFNIPDTPRDKHVPLTDNHKIPNLTSVKTTTDVGANVTHTSTHIETKHSKGQTAKPNVVSKTNQSKVDSTNKSTTIKPQIRKKPLFTMITEDISDKESESFIESKTTGRDYVLPIVLVILSLPIIAYIIKLIYRRGTEFTERQQYHRMYLIDGMYNSR